MNFFDAIAQKEYRNLMVFRELSRLETDPAYREVLEQLIEFETKHLNFWKDLNNYTPQPLPKHTIFIYRTVRKLFGLTFTLRYLELQEGDVSEQVRGYLFENDHPKRREMEEIILVSEPQESKLIRKIKEDRVEFMGSIVLGLNDGLIELSGALTGFSFAFRHNTTVVLAGFILGISASLSMASSAYLQARAEKSKDPHKSAVYTGFAYLVVVLVLVAPFILVQHSVEGAIALMLLFVLAIVTGLSFYTSVLFMRKFRDSLLEMLLFSIGTAAVTFLIGTGARQLFGLQI
jgi:vacuolar iron transporter family protein